MTEAILYKSFSKNPEAGNPAAVIDNSQNILNNSQMQAIASEINLPATAFFSEGEDSDCSVKFFSPTAESKICTHALLATACFLRTRAEENFEELSFTAKEDRYVTTKNSEGMVFIDLPKPWIEKRESVDRESLAQALKVPLDFFQTKPILVASTGKNKLIVPIKSLESLLLIDPDFRELKKVCESVSAEGVFLYASETIASEADFHARHFNPLTMDREDPICGVASGALGHYLKHLGYWKKNEYIIEQGHSTNSPGKVYLELGDIIRIGGNVVQYAKKAIEY